jgi:hypothetical protein
MDVLSLIVHVLNFSAPAVAVAAWITLISPLIWRSSSPWKAWKSRFVLNSLAGVLMLLLGFIWFGRDGKMISYAAMVLACATSQWLLTRKNQAQ